MLKNTCYADKISLKEKSAGTDVHVFEIITTKIFSEEEMI